MPKKFKIGLSPEDYNTMTEAFAHIDAQLKTDIENVMMEYCEHLRRFMEDYPDWRTKEYRIRLNVYVEEVT